LQYVCFGYHPRGLAWRWNPVFAGLGRLASHRHLMLHELWIGPPPAHRRLIGWGQKCTVRDLKSRFQADLVTTSNKSYQHRLARVGINSLVLPLFGNIPVATRDDDRIARLLLAAGSRWVQTPRSSFLNGVFFGTIHPDFAMAPFLAWLAKLQSQAAKPVLLSLIGRSGKAAEPLAKLITQANPGAFEVIPLGEQPQEVISQALQFADFGINTSSPELLGKSGTFAAMREHWLPVVVSDGELDAAYRQNDSPPVQQFTTNVSGLAMLNHARRPNGRAGALQTSLELINLFGKALIRPMPGRPAHLRTFPLV
jgi:hypothetical protein